MTAINNTAFNFFMIFSFGYGNSCCLADKNNLHEKAEKGVLASKCEEFAFGAKRPFLRAKRLTHLYQCLQKAELRNEEATVTERKRTKKYIKEVRGLAFE